MTEQTVPELSVVAPVFDEAACIDRFLDETHACLTATGRRFELICVDDGSRDDTLARLRAARARLPELRVLALSRHQGQSAALAAGIRIAAGAWTVLMDADLQYDPADIALLVDRATAHPGCVGAAGVRIRRNDPWIRRASSWLANRLAGQITGDVVSDTGCGLKVVRTSSLRALPFFHGAHRFLPTLLRMQGATVLEVAIHHRPRLQGNSKYGLGLARTTIALRDALGVRWMRDRQISSDARELVGGQAGRD